MVNVIKRIVLCIDEHGSETLLKPESVRRARNRYNWIIMFNHRSRKSRKRSLP
jgi:hypothetical protein